MIVSRFQDTAGTSGLDFLEKVYELLPACVHKQVNSKKILINLKYLKYISFKSTYRLENHRLVTILGSHGFRSSVIHVYHIKSIALIKHTIHTRAPGAPFTGTRLYCSVRPDSLLSFCS